MPSYRPDTGRPYLPLRLVSISIRVPPTAELTLSNDREHTIEENMLKKAEQKRLLDQHVIQEGDFTTDYFAKSDWRDMLGADMVPSAAGAEDETGDKDVRAALAAAEDEEDAVAAKEAEGETEGRLDNEDFDGPAAPTADSGVPTKSGGATGGQGTPVVTFEEGPSRQTETPALGDGTPAVEEMEEDEDELEGTVDGYMLNWVQEDWAYFGDSTMRW